MLSFKSLNHIKTVYAIFIKVCVLINCYDFLRPKLNISNQVLRQNLLVPANKQADGRTKRQVDINHKSTSMHIFFFFQVHVIQHCFLPRK